MQGRVVLAPPAARSPATGCTQASGPSSCCRAGGSGRSPGSGTKPQLGQRQGAQVGVEQLGPAGEGGVAITDQA